MTFELDEIAAPVFEPSDPQSVASFAAGCGLRRGNTSEVSMPKTATSNAIEMPLDGIANQWTNKILGAWQRSIDGILECGSLLLAAKQDLPHGEWGRMIEADLPFGRREAQRLMAIARDRRIANATRESLLPPHSETLYQLTKLDDATFEQLLADGTIHPEMKRRDVTGINYRRLQAADEGRVRSLVPAAGKYRTLVIDPPWETGGGRGLAYATMTQAQLMEMPVPLWTDENCHLYLWVTNGEIPNALQLMTQWGFQYKTTITWVKPEWSMGHFFRSQTEHVLFGVRGSMRTREAARSIPTYFEAPAGAHSEKPDAFYDIVRVASYGPYGEAFQRQAREAFANVYESAELATMAA